MSAKTFRPPLRRALAALAILLLTLAIGCGSAATATSQPASNLPQPSVPEATGETIKPLLATTVLSVGTQRVAFLLQTTKSLIKAPVATVTSTYLGEGAAPGEEKQASFHLWPYGVRGAYATQLNFDRPGPWQLDIAVEGPEGPANTQLRLDISESGSTSIPEIGSIPPFRANKTIHTVNGLEELTTDYSPDLDLYQMTVGEAIITGQPTVIVFATPAFCTSPTCGPQVDTVSELKEVYRDEANFIHVELYDNPDEIQGDLSKAVLSDLVHDWGLSSIPHWSNESWTFVLGADGRIAHRFEGFATLEELEEVLEAELAGI